MTPSAYAPRTFTVNYLLASFYWRAWAAPFGTWMFQDLNSPGTVDFRVEGHALNETIIYTPWDPHQPPSPVEGAFTVYTFDKKTGLWIQHEGTVTYKSAKYGDYTATNYLRGYIQFNGDPSATSFVHHVRYQWVYIYAPLEEEASIKSILPYAIWDSVMKAWLVGFGITLRDATGPQTYAIPFPFPFPEPVPASNYNPLGL